MELILEQKEAETILLAWAATNWPNAFDECTFDCSYGTLRKVTLSKEEPAPVEPLKADA